MFFVCVPPLWRAGQVPTRVPFLPPAPCGQRGRQGRTSSKACSTPTRRNCPPSAGTCSRIVSSRTSSSGTPGCSSRRTPQGSSVRSCIRWLWGPSTSPNTGERRDSKRKRKRERFADEAFVFFPFLVEDIDISSVFDLVRIGIHLCLS